MDNNARLSEEGCRQLIIEFISGSFHTSWHKFGTEAGLKNDVLFAINKNFESDVEKFVQVLLKSEKRTKSDVYAVLVRVEPNIAETFREGCMQ